MTPRNTFLSSPSCYPAEFGRFRSNGTSVIKIRLRNDPSCPAFQGHSRMDMDTPCACMWECLVLRLAKIALNDNLISGLVTLFKQQPCTLTKFNSPGQSHSIFNRLFPAWNLIDTLVGRRVLCMVQYNLRPVINDRWLVG